MIANERTLPSASERLEAVLARIAAPELQGATVFTEVLADTARQEAQASDARTREGGPLGPLDGRIVSVKALFDIAGKVTSAGSAILRKLPAASADAVVVKRLREAGAIIVGKTQMTEFAFSALGTNPHDGIPGNPRDRSRAPGGSSSGAVVSVVDGMAEIAIGSDTGGSIRIPAALSGAVGFKPSAGRVPTDGAFSLSSSLDTIGSIAANVADCALADGVLAERPPADLLPASKGSFKLIAASGRLFDRSEPAVADAFAAALDKLSNAGEHVEDGSLERTLDDLAAIDRIGTFPSVEVGATLKGLGFTNLDGVDPKTRVRIEAGAGILAADYVRMTRLRQAALRSFELAMTDDDIFVLPTTPIRAPLLSSLEEASRFHETNGLVLRNPRIANLLDCPSISLPLPIVGLPAGLMLIGRRNADRRLLEIAAQIESVLAASRT
jgi:aspartyl-tRNA(Asn)/glutamyl-tRNA(Gln) amidotransferase subunit A